MIEPCFNFEPDSVMIKAGGEAVLECHITGKPRPNVFWKNEEGKIVLPGERAEWSESDYGHYGFIVCCYNVVTIQEHVAEHANCQ